MRTPRPEQEKPVEGARPERAEGGFTLFELVVVSTLLAVSAAGLAVACAGMKQRARVQSTKSLVRALDAGCETFRSCTGAYPGAPLAIADTTILYQALCAPSAATGRGAGPGPDSSVRAPFVELPRERLTCAPQIHDDWGWPVRYTCPGRMHDGVDQSRRFDIDASSTEAGELGNWTCGR